MCRLAHQHETMAELIDGFSEEQVKQRVIDGKWSAFENMVHLVSYQPVFIDRLAQIAKGNQPFFDRYVAENDPLFYAYLQKSIPDLMHIAGGDRSFIQDYLSQLRPDQLRQKGLHAKFGAMTVTQWADLFLLHEAHHLWTMVQLVSILRVSLPG